MKYTKILIASKATTIPWVAKNLPVVQEGHIMTADMMDNIEAALTTAETVASTLATAQTDLIAANAAKVKAEGELATANARIIALEKGDSGKPSTPAAGAETEHETGKDDMSEFETSYDRERKAMNAMFK